MLVDDELDEREWGFGQVPRELNQSLQTWNQHWRPSLTTSAVNADNRTSSVQTIFVHVAKTGYTALKPVEIVTDPHVWTLSKSYQIWIWVTISIESICRLPFADLKTWRHNIDTTSTLCKWRHYQKTTSFLNSLISIIYEWIRRTDDISHFFVFLVQYID